MKNFTVLPGGIQCSKSTSFLKAVFHERFNQLPNSCVILKRDKIIHHMFIDLLGHFRSKWDVHYPSSDRKTRFLFFGILALFITNHFKHSGLLLIEKFYADDWRNFKYSPWTSINGSLAFNKNNPKSIQLLEMHKKGFEMIKKNGAYVRIMEQYWGKGNVPLVILPNDIASQGAEKFDPELFFGLKRKVSGKILQH